MMESSTQEEEEKKDSGSSFEIQSASEENMLNEFITEIKKV